MALLEVYMASGVVYSYKVATNDKGREHAHHIITTGYRHTPIGSDDLEWHPPHAILKVKVLGAGESNYKDNVRAT